MAKTSPSKSRRKVVKERKTPRETLLAAAKEYVRQYGLTDVPLRQIAAELGTSHRMLSYHFGSKEGLMEELMKSLEEDSMRFFAELRDDQRIGPVEKLRRFWRFISSPERAAGSRLWIDVFSQALRGRGYADDLLPGVIDSWLEPLGYICTQLGSTPEQAKLDGRVVLGVVHGLAVDWLATNDQKAADLAFARFLEILQAARSPAAAAPIIKQ